MKQHLKNSIFISYRRKDTGTASGRLYEHLENEFGADMVFTDIHDIGLGTDFRKAIGTSLMNCQVVLVMIGKDYTSIADAEGNPRIMKDNDYVNIEVSTALTFRNNKLVIPVLVNEARTPARDKLPASMVDITYLNSLRLTNENWKTDVAKLIKSIREYMKLDTRTTASPSSTSRSSRAQSVVSPRPVVAKKKSGKGIFIALGVAIALLLSIAGIMNMDKDFVPVKPASRTFTHFKGYVTATQLNVRSTPGTTTSDIITRLENGASVEVMNSREHEGKPWYQVNVDGHTGWVSSDFISGIAPTKMADDNLNRTTIPKIDHQPIPANPPPAKTPNYQQLAIGQWTLQSISYDGEAMALRDFMQVMAGNQMVVQSAALYYNLNGTTNNLTSYVNGVQLENSFFNYQISGNIFSMDNGTVAQILRMTNREFVAQINSFDGFGNGAMVFYFTRA